MYKFLLWATLVVSALADANSTLSTGSKPCDNNKGQSKVKVDLSDTSVNVNVTVGAGGSFAFQPDNVANRPVGSFVTFIFFPQAHTVTETIFAKPCVAAANLSAEDQQVLNGRTPISTGLVPVSPNDTTTTIFTYKIQDEKPVWLFCKPHCSSKGMVMVINQSQDPTVNKDKNIDNFRTAAKALAAAPAAPSPGTPAPAASSPAVSPPASSAPAGTSAAPAPLVSVFTGDATYRNRPTIVSAMGALAVVIGMTLL